MSRHPFEWSFLWLRLDLGLRTRGTGWDHTVAYCRVLLFVTLIAINVAVVVVAAVMVLVPGDGSSSSSRSSSRSSKW